MSLELWSRSSSSKKVIENSRFEREKRRNMDYDRIRRETTTERRNKHSSYKSYDERDYRREKGRNRARRYRSRSRSRSSIYEYKSKRKLSRDRRSSSYDEKKLKSNIHMRKHVQIVRASLSRSKSKSPEMYSNIEEKNIYLEMFKSDKNSTKIINSTDDDFDKERIHKEMQERLIQHLAKEGKVYPPPKPQASHPIFANDGSFLETFKKMQEQQQQKFEQIEGERKFVQQKPVFGKRRGGKILKTGIVQKPKLVDELSGEINQNDAWALYLQEVKKYKNVSCDADSKTRPLVK